MAVIDYATVIRLLVVWLVLSGLFLVYRNQALLINKKQLPGIFSRLIIAWRALFFFYTQYHLLIIKALLPVFSFLLNHIQSDYTATLSWFEKTTELIKINIKTVHTIPPYQSGTELNQYYHFLTILQQMALHAAILIASPVKHFFNRLILFIISLFLSLVLLAIAVPFLMANQYETLFSRLASVVSVVRPTPYYHGWVQFITHDGHLVLIVFMVILAIQIEKKITHLHQSKYLYVLTQSCKKV